MRIWGKLVFDRGTQVLRTVVGALCSLPEPLRATRHGEGEGEVTQPIEDVATFLMSLSSGLVLRAKSAQYIVWAPYGNQIECMCRFKARATPLVKNFMEHMATVKPVFGFASAWDEYAHRNQIDVRLRLYREQAIVGKDLSKYVPGLYWVTLLPDDLAKRHGVLLSKVRQVALEHVDLGGGQQLFRFHDHPSKWRAHADDLDGLCAAMPGVFNIAHLRSRLVGVTEEKEFDAIMKPWR